VLSNSDWLSSEAQRSIVKHNHSINNAAAYSKETHFEVISKDDTHFENKQTRQTSERERIKEEDNNTTREEYLETILKVKHLENYSLARTNFLQIISEQFAESKINVNFITFG